MGDVRIVIVDDSEVYLSTQELVLGLQEGIEVVATVQDATDAARVCVDRDPDVAVIDYRMPGADGAAVTRAVREANPRTAVVCVAGGSHPRSTQRSSTPVPSRSSTRDGRWPSSSAAINHAAGRPMNLTRENTAIVLDSTADFTDAPARYPNMRVVPLYIRFGDDAYKDGVEMDATTFYERLAAAPQLPTTSQPTPQDFIEAYHELDGYDRIWSLHLTSKLSGTFQSACLAAEELGGDRVTLVDTETASLSVAQLSLAMQRRLERGTTDEELTELVDRFKRDARVVFTVGTLEYLQKGGRIGKAQAMAGSLLNVKPILSVEDGVIEPVARVRGRQKALEEFTKMFTESTENREGLRVAIAHANAPEWVDVITDMVKKTRPAAEVEVVTNLGAVVGAHTGPGSVGFFWFQD